MARVGKTLVLDPAEARWLLDSIYNLFGQQIERPRRDESGREILAGDEGYEYDRESDEGDRRRKPVGREATKR